MTQQQHAERCVFTVPGAVSEVLFEVVLHTASLSCLPTLYQEMA